MDNLGWTDIRETPPPEWQEVLVAFRSWSAEQGQPVGGIDVAYMIDGRLREDSNPQRPEHPLADRITHWRLPPPLPAGLQGHLTHEQAKSNERDVRDYLDARHRAFVRKAEQQRRRWLW